MTNEMKTYAYQDIIAGWEQDIIDAEKKIAELESRFFGKVFAKEYKDGMAMANRTISIAREEIAKYKTKIAELN